MKYTSEERLAELKKYKLPWISKVFKKFGVPFIRYSFLPVLIILVIFGAIYNGSSPGVNDWMWFLVKYVGLFYIVGFGVFALLSKLSEQFTANRLRKKLGLTHYEFKILVQGHQITGM